MLSGKSCCSDFTFYSSFTKAAWHKDAMHALEVIQGILTLKYFCINPVHINFYVISDTAMIQSLGESPDLPRKLRAERVAA